MRINKLYLNLDFLSLVLFFITCFFSCQKIEREPKIETGTVSDITSTSAKATGNIIDLGEGITDHGHCWSATSNPPTFSDSKTALGATAKTGSFTSDLQNLQPGINYYLRAYIEYGNDVLYGNEVSFTTGPMTIPTVLTNNVTSISSTSVICGGNVTDDGGAQVTDRGVCWSTDQNPTIVDDRSSNGTGTGSFESKLTSLVPFTSYYARSFATNFLGTTYGVQVSFKTLFEGCEIGTFTDSRDGQLYDWVRIGNQIWMAENLNYGSMINSSVNQQNNNIIEKYCFCDDTTSCNLYGGLYQWNEMMNYSILEKSQGICPTGWHIPDKADWQTLLDKIDLDGFTDYEGTALKTASEWHIQDDVNGNGINAYGFSVLPGGSRGTDGGFHAQCAWFWSSMSYWNIYIEWWQNNLSWYNLYDFNTEAMNAGQSVRCIKD